MHSLLRTHVYYIYSWGLGEVQYETLVHVSLVCLRYSK